MTIRFDPSRLIAPLSVALGVAVLGGALAGAFGGGGAFSWMLLHGLSGPLAPMLLHHSGLSPSNLLTALTLLGVLATRAMISTRTIAAVAIAAAAAWVLMGWSSGV